MLTDPELETSSVVANNAMNRGRGLDGVNSYTRELGFHPLDRLPPGGAWLDLCCGSGMALLEAAHRDPSLRITGVDLVDFFADGTGVEFVTASVGAWKPQHRFDLITCVHGLHYIGDKLGLIARAVSWLAPGGRFAAHLDLANVVVHSLPDLPGNQPASQRSTADLPGNQPVPQRSTADLPGNQPVSQRSAADPARKSGNGLSFRPRRFGLGYDARRRLLTAEGPRDIEFPFVYEGADDRAGPNATGQPAVNSHYSAGAVRPAPPR